MQFERNEHGNKFLVKQKIESYHKGDNDLVN